MKKIISMILIIVLLLTMHTPALAKESSDNSVHSVSEKNLFNYLQGDNPKLLVISSNYGYMMFIKEFRNNVWSNNLFEITDKLINTGTKPDTQKYMEVLINIIATYDLDNASNISEQKKRDNLKDFKDYAVDYAETGSKAISMMLGNNPAAKELETFISTAVSGLSTLMANTDNWIEGLSNLETIVQNYTSHDNFLKTIEKNSTGDLKEAARTLRMGMAKAIKIKLNTYNEISNENFKNYQEFFFSDVFFDGLKYTKEYESDETFKFFVDSGNDLISKISMIKTSWELVKLVGILVGDFAVGGEDLINRIHEMMALYDISLVLKNEILEIGNEFEENSNNIEANIVNDYVSFSQYLIGCRIRGEYCLSSIVANDAGLLSWFNKKSAKEAKEWYDSKVEKILAIQRELLKIMEKNQDYTWIVEPAIEADDIYYVRNFDVEQKSLNELNLQLMDDYAVFKQDDTLGLIDMDGNKKIIKGCETIYSFDNHLMLSSPQGLYTLKNNQLTEEYGRGYGYSAYFLNNNQLHSYWAFEEDFGIINEAKSTQTIAVPVFKMSDTKKWYSPEQIMTPPYAIHNNGRLVTDFIYEECGTESNGLLAVKKNGKWGYVNSKGEIVISIEYDPSWDYYSEDIFGYTRKEYCYAASDGYIVLCKDNQWELSDITGNNIIPKGVFEAIRPVYEGKCWVKKDGKWGVIQIDTSKEAPQTEDTSVFASMPSEGIFSSGAGGWATNMNLKSDGTFTGVYYDSDLGFTGEGYPHGTTKICNFNGKFSNPEKIDDYTYRTELEELTKDGVVGEEYIEDGMKYIYSDAYGLEGGKEFLIYTPGKPLSELPETFLSWVRMIMPDAFNDDMLSCYGIYSEQLETAFFFYNK